MQVQARDGRSSTREEHDAATSNGIGIWIQRLQARPEERMVILLQGEGGRLRQWCHYGTRQARLHTNAHRHTRDRERTGAPCFADTAVTNRDWSVTFTALPLERMHQWHQCHRLWRNCQAPCAERGALCLADTAVTNRDCSVTFTALPLERMQTGIGDA